MPPDWGDITHIMFQIHCVGGAVIGKKPSQVGTNSFSLYEKATVSFFFSRCLASLNSCVAHSRVTYRFLKDRTTEQRDRKDTVLQFHRLKRCQPIKAIPRFNWLDLADSYAR